MSNGQIVPVIDDHGHLVVSGSSACAPAGDHVEFVRPTGLYSVHVEGIYPATGRAWRADMRLPLNWKHSGRRPQLQAFVRERG